MSNNSDNNSLNTLHKKQQVTDKDTIPMRIEFIKNLLEGTDLNPIVNFDDTATENFIGNVNSADSGDTHDTRVVLQKRLLDFKNIITQIGGKLKYIKSGTTGHTFKGIAQDGNGSFEYAVKVVAYPKKERYGSINDVRRPENAELKMIKLLSYFIINKQTPHLVIPFGTFNTSIEHFVNLVKFDKIDEKNERYKDFIDKYHQGEFSSQVSILISEWANKGDFLDFLRNNYTVFTPTHWKVFMFQIISTLAIIQSKYPAFRHNDMKANNILIHKIDITKDYHRYIVVRNKYKVPNIGYQIKLWDFDFACIPGIVDNIKVQAKWTKKINVTPEQNRYYDVHYFFNTLIRKGFFPQILTDKCVPQELKDFIGRILPTKYRTDQQYIHEKGRILINDEYLTPEQIIKTDPYFNDFRSNKINTKTIKINTNDQSPLISIVQSPIENKTEPQIEVTTNVYKLIKEKPIKSKLKKIKPHTNTNIDILKLLENTNNTLIPKVNENDTENKKNNNDILDLINKKIKYN